MQWWRDHFAVLAGALTTAFVAARLLFIARFDVNTAATVLDAVGVGTVVAGTTLTLLPCVLGLSALALAVLVYVDPTLSPLAPEPARVLLWTCVVASVALLALQLGLVVLLVVVAVTVAARRRRGPLLDLRAVVAGSRLVRGQLRVLAVVAVLTPLALQRPWLPTETVVLDLPPQETCPSADGERRGEPPTCVLVGYALGDQEGRLAVLRERDRAVVLVDPERVTERYLCTGFASPQDAAPVNRVWRVQLDPSLVSTAIFGADVPSYPPCGEPRRDG